jgi:hypothetical protein
MAYRRGWKQLCRTLLDGLGDQVAERGHPTWVMVSPSPLAEDGFSLGVLDDRRSILGWKAPPDCAAVGVVATGRMSVDGDGHELPHALRAGAEHEIRMSCLVTRSGEVASLVELPGGEAIEETPAEGRVLDCLKRCLGLPTPPPPVGAEHLDLLQWLVAIIEEATRSPQQLSWRQIARLHPCGSPPGLGESLPAQSWELLRVLTARRLWGAELLDPDLAQWMDDGMFARWVLASLPAPAELLQRLRPLVAPSAARRLAHSVHSAA